MTNVSGGAAQGGGESVRRLRRRVEHRALAGVAGGLADYLNVPAWLARLGFVLLAFTGTGILLYAIGWVLIPAQGESESLADRALQRTVDGPAWLGGLLLLIGALLIASRTHLINPPLVWGIALIVAGVFVFRRSELRGRDQERRAQIQDQSPQLWTAAPATGQATLEPVTGESTVAAPPPVPDFPVAVAAATTDELAAPPPPSAPAWAPPPPPPAPRPTRERSGLGWFVLGLALAVAGLLATLDQAGAISLRPGQYMGVILAILGAGMLVGAWIGRARWLAIPALLLLPVVIAASLIHVPFRGGLGERIYTPTTITGLQPEYRLIAGHLTVDLSRIDVGASTVTVRASVVAGRLDVIVPTNTTVIVSGTVSAGSADLFGVHRDGNDVSLATLNPGQAGSGTIRLELGTTYGYVRVDGPASGLSAPLEQKGAALLVPKAPLAPKAPLLVLPPTAPTAPSAPVG
jgi:phage shock protein PspC (stress-responsive transcriptional regulator)